MAGEVNQERRKIIPLVDIKSDKVTAEQLLNIHGEGMNKAVYQLYMKHNV